MIYYCGLFIGWFFLLAMASLAWTIADIIQYEKNEIER